MKFIPTVKQIFASANKEAVVNDHKPKTLKNLSKLSAAFLLPISVMAFAGLFLGIGAAIRANTAGSAQIFGNFIYSLADPIFSNMSLLFMIAIVVSFTDDVATAVFSGVVGYLVFTAIQAPFIETRAFDASGNTGSAKVLYNLNADLSQRIYKIVGSNLGIKSLNTSIFGGIIIGFACTWAYKKFHEVELPTAISFFGGKRFVSFVCIILAIPFSFIFLAVWPWVGLGLSYFGEYSGKVYGLDSFAFGYIERALIPLGLHHVFYAPL